MKALGPDPVHIRRWEAIGGRFQLRWDVDEGQYHCWPVDPDRDLDAAETMELASLRRSYRQVRPTLKAAILSFLIDRDGDPKPDPEALEFIRIMRSERLDMERMTALAAFYEHESVEPLLHSILRGLGPMIADWRELTCAANHLLLAAALVHRPQQPQLSLVRD